MSSTFFYHRNSLSHHAVLKCQNYKLSRSQLFTCKMMKAPKKSDSIILRALPECIIFFYFPIKKNNIS